MKFKRKSRSIALLLILVVSVLNINLLNFSNKTQAENIYPSSIILFIGDGMGLEQIKFGSLVEFGEEGFSSILNFPFNTTVSTTNIDGTKTDSAAAATAISTGIKTQNGRIATNWDGEMELTTILEIAQMNGYATGLVATCHLTHATPAAFAAHEGSRGDYLNIAEDFSQADVDVFLGGGSGLEYIGNYIDNFTAQGYEYVTEEAELDLITKTPVLGLFTEVSFPKLQTIPEDSTIPTLSEMTIKAIELLNATSQPFFLMIEGSQIDWAGHANDQVYLAHQIIEFEKAVKYAKTLAEQVSDLQVLVTADHETGGLSIENYSFKTEIPLETDSYKVKQEKRTNRSQEITVDWGTGGHTNTKVILAGYGPFTEEILTAKHHIDTFSIMRQAIDGQSEPIGEGYYKGHLPIYAWILVLFSPMIISVSLAFITVKIIRRKKTTK